MTKIAIVLTVIHFVLYLYLFVVPGIVKVLFYKFVEPSSVILKLMTEYKVNIRMFQRNGRPYGIASFKTIYLNTSTDKVRMRGKKDPHWALKWSFYHEYYHLLHKHKAKTLLMRFFFSFVPLLLIWHWLPFTIIYVLIAYLMHYVHEKFEKDANFYAEYKMTN
jgi:hypothetical protein